MFKVNNKDTRTTPGVVLVSLLLTLNMFHTLFSAFTVNFEQVIAGWDKLYTIVDATGALLTLSLSSKSISSKSGFNTENSAASSLSD